MKRSKSRWLIILAILLGGSITTFAQGGIQLVNGSRAIKDNVSFIVEVAHQKNENAAFATAPGYMYLYMTFDHAASGLVYVDGKAVARFDQSTGFNVDRFETSYGRHTLTVVLANPAAISYFRVTLDGGLPREILEGETAEISFPSGLEERIVQLERKLHELEAEIATLKRKRSR
jgi:hypothetical protein